MNDYKVSVFIGRFQPLHNSHLEVIRHALSISDKLILILGSANSAPTIKNPFSFETRSDLIRASLTPNESDRVIIVPVRDYHYNDNTWVADIQAKTDPYINDGDTVALVGNYKDSSSYYLKYFPQWEFVPAPNSTKLDASTVRDLLFNVNPETHGVTELVLKPADLSKLKSLVPKSVFTFLKEFVNTRAYTDLVEEYNFIKEYKKRWKSAPYAPTFVTTDAVVTCSGHVLVIKRKFNPGKGLYALPGGFIRQDERIRDAAIRELKEETGIKVDKIILDSSVVDSKVFDHPGRSLRGRTVTHGFHIKLKDGKLPEIKANDDALIAQWMPLMDVGKNEPIFYEDHSHIIHYFINKL